MFKYNIDSSDKAISYSGFLQGSETSVGVQFKYLEQDDILHLLTVLDNNETILNS